MRKVRLFLAINFSLDVRRAVYAATAPLRRVAPDLGWIAAERLHLTLKFLGELPESTALVVAEAVREIVARHDVVPMVLGGVGAFPSLRRPRVIWLGIGREPRLELLQNDIESRCAELGFEVEGRPFRPHVTLARVRARLDAGETRVLASAARRVTFRETVNAEAVDLMRSELSPAGARHTLLASSPLRLT